jgi:hypothetical protein
MIVIAVIVRVLNGGVTHPQNRSGFWVRKS